MSALQARIDFSADVGRLLSYARTLGFEFVIDEVRRGEQQAEWNATHCRYIEGDGKRCERRYTDHGKFEHEFKPIGIRDSEHTRGRAIDLYIIIDAAISNDAELYERLGAKWKELHKDNVWGGDFEGFADLGHFERRIG